MTPERAKELLPIIAAFAEKRKLQCRLFDRVMDNPWLGFNCEFADFDNPNWEWRIKPEVNIRPFTQSEAMRFRLFRYSSKTDAMSPMIFGINGVTVFPAFSKPMYEELYEDLKTRGWQCSIDGVTWLPCGVEVGS